MKHFFHSICIIVFAFLINIPTAFANRGDIIEHEELDYFESSDVVDFFIGQFDNYLNPEDSPEFFALATAFFNQLIDQRNITVHKMVYETIDFYGEPTVASGIIMIPGHENYTCTPSFSIYAHGTVFARESVNSRPSNWGGEFMLTLMMASINTICVAPDYYGLGDGEGFHHHNTYKTNVNSSLDCVRAGRKLCDELGLTYNNRLMPMGYSEGGHASMGIARMVREEGLQNEFRIPFVGAGSGAYDMSGEAFDFILGNPYYITPQYILYQLATCEDIYGNLVNEDEGESYSTYLTAPYDELFETDILEQTGNTGWVASYWPSMFHPDKVEELVTNVDHPFRQCLANSNVFDWFNNYPTIMYYCTTDEQVPYSGALKTRDVQRSLIPWYLFWNRFKIQALNLTLDGTISSHEMCALPSIFLQVALMDKTLGLHCDYTGRTEGSVLRSVEGEELDGKVIYFAKSIDLDEIGRRSNPSGEKSVVTGMNMQTGTFYNASENSRMTLSENGFYLFRIDQPDGSYEMNWLYKADPDFVNTDDYDPITTNPMNDRSAVDISLLEEEVRQVAIMDIDGHEHSVIQGPFTGTSVGLERTASMMDGDYIVEVRTALNNYSLEMKVGRDELDAALEVYPNPAVELLNIDLITCNDEDAVIMISDASGRSIPASISSVVDCKIQLNVEHLPVGIYNLSVVSGEKERNTRFVRLAN